MLFRSVLEFLTRDSRGLPRTLKATRIACEELENGLVEYDFVEPDSIDEDKDGNKRRK